MSLHLNDIVIRTELLPGDLGHVVERHGKLYFHEYGYGIGFESYVAGGLHEFYMQFDPLKDCTWIAEHNGSIVGFILLMHRSDHISQLRYFYTEPGYRGIGLGKKLMKLLMTFLVEKKYERCFLLTTSELHAAASLYTHYGFRLTKETPVDFFGKPVAEQRYEWTKLV